VFFPPNCTSKVQPHDQGIIKNFKLHYRNIIINKILRKFDINLDPQIGIVDAIFSVDAAWRKVKQETITNCFKHSKIMKEYNIENSEENAESVYENENNDEIGQRFNLEKFSLEDYVTFDDQVSKFFNECDLLCNYSW